MASKIPLPENKNHILVQFIRNKKNQRIGVLVGIPDPENRFYRIGWSQARSHVEKFDKEQGMKIALGRAQANSDMSEMPKSLHLSPLYHQFMDRCDAYFKVNEQPIK